jgi:hypothetical protein
MPLADDPEALKANGRRAGETNIMSKETDYTVNVDTITDPSGSVMQGVDEFSMEMQGLMNALKNLYVESALLRMCVSDNAPKIKIFSSWVKHSEAMKEAELWVHPSIHKHRVEI